jgi:lipopolysaccharide transport system permease protein
MPLRPPSDRIFKTETVIRPSTVGLGVQLRELWRYRHLFVALVWRNVRVEFDATRLGSAWAMARPLLFAAVFGLFKNLSGADTRVDEIPYILYVYSGLLLWTYFTDAATNSASAVRMDTALLNKVYYPRLLTPSVPAVASLLTLVVGLIPLGIMMAWYEVRPSWLIVLLPIVLAPCVILALGLGTLVSTLSIANRDWERVLAFGLTIALWLSPVIYAPDMIPARARDFYLVNPMVGPLVAFRAALFGDMPIPIAEWLYSLASSTAILAIGVWAFRRAELRLVDRLRCPRRSPRPRRASRCRRHHSR